MSGFKDSTILVKTFDQWRQEMDDENNIHDFGGKAELQGEVVVIDEQCGVEHMRSCFAAWVLDYKQFTYILNWLV